MKKLVVSVCLVLLLIAGMGGYVQAGDISGLNWKRLDLFDKIRPPEIGSLSFDWGDVNRDFTELKIAVFARNPNDKTLSVYRLTFDVYANDIKVVQGFARDWLIIPANGEAVINFSLRLYHHLMGEWLHSHIDNGEKTIIKIAGSVWGRYGYLPIYYPFTLERTFITDLFSPLRLLNQRSLNPLPFSLKSLSASWGPATPTSVVVNFRATINNRSAFTYTWHGVSGEVVVNGILLIRVQSGDIILNSGDNTLSFTATINSRVLGELWYEHWRNKETSEVIIKIGGKENLVPAQLNNAFLDYVGITKLILGSELKTHLIDYLNERIGKNFLPRSFQISSIPK